MKNNKMQQKFKEWLARYMLAELLGTFLAVCFAFVSFSASHSYIVAAGAGFVGEGIGFYGFMIIRELKRNGNTYSTLPIFRRLAAIISKSSTNLIVEFAPGEIIDNIFIRPFLMYYVPQHLKPYALGFIAGKLSADVVFYIFAITAYELKKRIPKRTI